MCWCYLRDCTSISTTDNIDKLQAPCKSRGGHRRSVGFRLLERLCVDNAGVMIAGYQISVYVVRSSLSFTPAQATSLAFPQRLRHKQASK